ncbi:MAG: Verru_Chthon cassette protein B [Chthoniobacteraceae bacterium]
MRHPSPKSPRGKSAGFTLVEVSIAVGILAVALVALLGLMPAGMTNFRKAMDTSTTAQIAQRILLDMQQADFDQIVDAKNDTGNQATSYTFTAPLRNSQQYRFFDEQGNELISPDGTNARLSTAQKTALVYQVNIRIMPTASEPANADTIKGSVALVTVQVARNPNNRTLTVYRQQATDAKVSYRNLFDPNPKVNPGLQVYTYSALIGKNQG